MFLIAYYASAATSAATSVSSPSPPPAALRALGTMIETIETDGLVMISKSSLTAIWETFKDWPSSKEDMSTFTDSGNLPGSAVTLTVLFLM